MVTKTAAATIVISFILPGTAIAQQARPSYPAFLFWNESERMLCVRDDYLPEWEWHCPKIDDQGVTEKAERYGEDRHSDAMFAMQIMTQAPQQYDNFCLVLDVPTMELGVCYR